MEWLVVGGALALVRRRLALWRRTEGLIERPLYGSFIRGSFYEGPGSLWETGGCCGCIEGG
jgi:hypothetical protein